MFLLLTSLADIVFADDLPTERELQTFSVRVEMKPGVFMPIGPVKGLKCPIANCLPPSGPYYDEFILESTFGEAMFDVYANGEIRVCIVCWGPKHEDSYKRCKRKCRVCGTCDHPGQTCGQIYARMSWWKARGHKVVKTQHIRPGVGEFVYLVKAEIVHSFRKFTDAVNVNEDHPLVRELFRTTSMPLYTPGRTVWPKSGKSQKQSTPSVEGPSNPEGIVSHVPGEVQEAQKPVYGSKPSNRGSNHSVDSSRDPRLMARRVVDEEDGVLGGEVAPIVDQPVTHESGGGDIEASTSGQDTSHQSERNRFLEAENRRLVEELRQARIELVAKDARIAELTGDSVPTGTKRPRT